MKVLMGHIHEYEPLFKVIRAKLTVVNNLSIIINCEQNSRKYTV